jgi:hypothetical protein
MGQKSRRKRERKRQDAGYQFVAALWHEDIEDFIDQARDQLQQLGQPEDAVVVLRMDERLDDGAPARIIGAQPWIGPLARIQQIVPDVPAAILAEIHAIHGDQFPVLVWSTFRDGRPPAAKVFAFDRVDRARERAQLRRQVDRVSQAMRAARAMVPPEQAILYCALRESFVMAMTPVPCVRCQDPTRDGGAVVLAPSYQATQFASLPEQVVVALLVPLCGSCTRRYQADPSSFEEEALDHAMDLFWDGGLLMATAEDRRDFPWLQRLLEELQGLQDSEDDR